MNAQFATVRPLPAASNASSDRNPPQTALTGNAGTAAPMLSVQPETTPDVILQQIQRAGTVRQMQSTPSPEAANDAPALRQARETEAVLRAHLRRVRESSYAPREPSRFRVF